MVCDVCREPSMCVHVHFSLLGFVSNGEYNTMRVKGYTRPLSVLENQITSKKEVRQSVCNRYDEHVDSDRFVKLNVHTFGSLIIVTHDFPSVRNARW